MKPSVEVEGLSKIYEPIPAWMRLLVRSSTQAPVTALEDVSFRLEAGQICAVIGPNGAGKSTLFRLLTGLTTPSSGSVRVMGIDPVSEGHRVRRVVGFMPSDDRTLFLRHTCRENLHFHGRLQGMEETVLRKKTDETLELVGLAGAKDRTGFALSSGMRARLMFARAILHEPKVLILDEPTGAIDPVAASELLMHIQRTSRERGIATLISSHRVEEIEALRDNVMLLDRGRVIYWGDLEVIRHTWERPRLELEFVDLEAREAALLPFAERGDDVTRLGDSSLILATDEATGPVLQRISNLQQLRSLSPRPMALSELLRIAIDNPPSPPEFS